MILHIFRVSAKVTKTSSDASKPVRRSGLHLYASSPWLDLTTLVSPPSSNVAFAVGLFVMLYHTHKALPFCLLPLPCSTFLLNYSLSTSQFLSLLISFPWSLQLHQVGHCVSFPALSSSSEGRLACTRLLGLCCWVSQGDHCIDYTTILPEAYMPFHIVIIWIFSFLVKNCISVFFQLLVIISVKCWARYGDVWGGVCFLLFLFFSSIKHNIIWCNKIRYISSYQGMTRQPSRRNRVP